MPVFNPTEPQNGEVVDADFLRNQFNGLKDLIDTGSGGTQGPPGPPGPQGLPGEAGLPGPAGPAGAQGDTGPQGDQGPQGDAGTEGRHVTNVSDNGSGQAIIEMSDATTYGPFTVASGPAGADGAPGPQGEQGPQGDAGPAGEPGTEGRHVTNVYDNGSGQAIIEMSDATTYGPFTVASGPAGADGAQGAEGPQGPMGEVSAQQLSDAIAGTPSNVNGVEPMNLTVSDPPSQSEMQTIANKLDELINALKRA